MNDAQYISTWVSNVILKPEMGFGAQPIWLPTVHCVQLLSLSFFIHFFFFSYLFASNINSASVFDPLHLFVSGSVPSVTPAWPRERGCLAWPKIVLHFSSFSVSAWLALLYTPGLSPAQLAGHCSTWHVHLREVPFPYLWKHQPPNHRAHWQTPQRQGGEVVKRGILWDRMQKWGGCWQGDKRKAELKRGCKKIYLECMVNNFPKKKKKTSLPTDQIQICWPFQGLWLKRLITCMSVYSSLTWGTT